MYKFNCISQWIVSEWVIQQKWQIWWNKWDADETSEYVRCMWIWIYQIRNTVHLNLVYNVYVVVVVNAAVADASFLDCFYFDGYGVYVQVNDCQAASKIKVKKNKNNIRC